MKAESQTEVLMALHRIEDRLQEITGILKISHQEKINSTQERLLEGSPLRKQIYELCDGSNSVGKIAKTLGKSIQQISNNIVILHNSGLLKEVRKGNSKLYKKTW
ncbi:MAG: helix-turn-helix domain-containing protein [Candidatus Bathyarchaeia archaeon]